MQNILEELWYGNICPNSDYFKITKETRELMRDLSDHHSNLISILNDDQRDIFEKFNECNVQLSDVYERKIFEYAFKLGARIAIEVMDLKI